MPFLTRRVLLHLRQSVLNSSKKTETTSNLVHGIPNTKVSSVRDPGAAASAASEGFSTSSRSDFAKAFPGLYEKQEYHLKRLRAGHPVHLSGKYDTTVNTVIYVLTALVGGYALVHFVGVIRNS